MKIGKKYSEQREQQCNNSNRETHSLCLSRRKPSVKEIWWLGENVMGQMEEVRQKVEGEILHFVLFEGSWRVKHWIVAGLQFLKILLSIFCRNGVWGTKRGHREGTETKYVFKRSIKLTNGLSGGVEIKMNQKWLLRSSGLDRYLDGKSVLRWGELEKEACF